MGRAAAKRPPKGAEESPNGVSASKKRKTEKKKIAPQKVESPEAQLSPFLKEFCERFAKPEDSVKFLLENAKMPVSDFFDKVWGKKPLAMVAAEESKDLHELFSMDYLKALVKLSATGNEDKYNLAPERDYVISKFDKEMRDDATVDDLDEKLLEKYFKDKYGILINQPQRFQDALWALTEKLECYFGSLVSCRGCVAPADAKLTPARFEDTEIFVIQTRGSSSWTLNKLKDEPKLEFNDDVTEEETGEKLLSVTLKAGDVLYVPKRTIFDWKATSDCALLTFSTYQGLTKATLLNQTVGPLIEDLSMGHPELSSGLPIGFLPMADGYSNAVYADLLTKLAEYIKAREEPLPRPEGLIQDFMTYRLPPFGLAKSSVESEATLNADSKVSLKNKHHITWFTRKFSETHAGEDAFDEDTGDDLFLGPQTELVVFSSISNNRNRHMMVESRMLGMEGDAFSTDVEYQEVLEAIFNSDTPIAVKDLPTKNKKDRVYDPLVLVKGLHNVGALNIH